MQPSEEIVEKLAVALGESVTEAREAANYPSTAETAEENIRFELSEILPKYDRLSDKSRQFINRQFKETIDFLLQIECMEMESISIEGVKKPEGFGELTKSPNKPEMLSDEEIIRLGIKPIKVGDIKKEAP